MLTSSPLRLAPQVNKSIKQEDVSRGGNAQREATPMPVPISQANCAAGPSTTSQQQAAPAPFQQRSIHATVSDARGRVVLMKLIDLPRPYPCVLHSHPSYPQMPLGLASSSHRHLPSPCVPPPLSAYFHAPQQGSHPQQTSYTHHGPSAIPPPRFPDPWYSSAAYHSARQSLNLVNDISIQVAVLLDEARWYEKSFSSLAPYPTWLSDRQAEVQEIVWRYQGSWRRFEKHVAAAARLALLELERAAGLEQGGG